MLDGNNAVAGNGNTASNPYKTFPESVCFWLGALHVGWHWDPWELEWGPGQSLVTSLSLVFSPYSGGFC